MPEPRLLHLVLRRAPGVLTLVAIVALAGCASGAARGGSVAAASEAEWRALATPRPSALVGAARVSLTDVQIVGELPWDVAAPVTAALGVTELAAAGLLRRADVHFVERRRFTAAVAAERGGARRAPGAPPAGVSPGAEFLASASWLSLIPGQGSVELRLTDARTGRVVASARTPIQGEPSPLRVARGIVSSVLEALDEVGRRPAWTDPRSAPAGMTSGDEPTPAAVGSFFRGLVAEERWDWEAARSAYQSASAAAGFAEAEAALARTARLRMGGTLGEN